MADITTSTLDGLVKRIYSSGEIDDLVNLTSEALERCASQGNAQLGGEGFYGPARLRSAEGHGYIAEDGDFPTPRQTTVKQWVVRPKVQVGNIRLTGLSQEVSRGNAAAFAMTFDENVQGTIRAMTAYKEGALFRDGTAALTTFTADAGASAGPWTVADSGFLREGMAVLVWDISTAATTKTWYGPYTIIAVDWANDTVTFDAALDAAIEASDVLYLAGTQGPTGTSPVVDKEPEGLEKSVLATGFYLGVDRAAEGNWRAQSITVSAPLDVDFLLRARSRIVQETGIPISAMGNRFALLCHQTIADQLFKIAMPQIQYSGTANIDLLNPRNINLGGIPIITSHQCLPSKAYLGDWTYHRSLYTPGGKLHIDTKHGGTALKWVANKDMGHVYMVEYSAFVLRHPQSFVRFTSITEAVR